MEKITILLELLEKDKINVNKQTKMIHIDPVIKDYIQSKNIARYRIYFKTKIKVDGKWYANAKEVFDKIDASHNKKCKDLIKEIESLKGKDKPKKETPIDNTLLKYNKDQIRYVMTKDEDLWFLGKDVCKILGYDNTEWAISNYVHDEENKKKFGELLSRVSDLEDRLKKVRKHTIFINEFGINELILSSKKTRSQKI